MASALESGNLENNRLALAIQQSSDALFITNPEGEMNFGIQQQKNFSNFPAKTITKKISTFLPLVI